jgi:hypothetical protein
MVNVSSGCGVLVDRNRRHKAVNLGISDIKLAFAEMLIITFRLDVVGKRTCLWHGDETRFKKSNLHGTHFVARVNTEFCIP